MAFRKSGIAINTRVLGDKEAAELSGPPANPEVGDEWNGKYWDGGAWVSRATFERTRSQ